MHMLEDPTFKTSKARIYYGKLDKISELILEVALTRGGKSYEKLMDAIQELPKILDFCGANSNDTEFVQTTLEDFLSNPSEVTPRDLKEAQEIIGYYKIELKKFTDEQYYNWLVEESKLEKYVDELEKYVYGDEFIERKKIRDEILKVIYHDPGHYLSSLQKYLSKKFGKISYSTVRYYVNDLENKNKIITIGGPQGRYRYCFPNPELVDNRKVYYGKYFGIRGNVKELISDTEKMKVCGLRGMFLDIYVVNSNIKPIFLAIPYGAVGDLEVGALIESYGKIEPYSELKKIGYVVDDKNMEFDVLFGFKVAEIVDDNKKEDLWVGEEAILKLWDYS